ncbi:hypothetical protein SLEP1_g53703 [Rubroshorea leprosula]|uniref:Uncharacterized protein n=1 Tax=Rubroshorea leprosula TaxID=152421 RepID=A0AAV5MCY7_9ROSI|nr:hypothetical protein SLEP1_g53703 [Rubroshorea leprosula]
MQTSTQRVPQSHLFHQIVMEVLLVPPLCGISLSMEIHTTQSSQCRNHLRMY